MKELTQKVVEWIKENTARIGSKKTIVGISGGKDSTVVSALCVAAMGKENVFGLLMPNGDQKDISDSYKVVDHLGIEYDIVNIGDAFREIAAAIPGFFNSDAARTNLPARLRMSTLYAYGQTIGATVMNTCNLSEDYAPGGYATLFGDSAGSLAPIQDLTVTEVIGIGEDLNLPTELIHKIPVDGLQPLSDEEKISKQTGISNWTYARFDKLIRCETHDFTPEEVEILKRGALSGKFKREIIQIPRFNANRPNFFEMNK